MCAYFVFTWSGFPTFARAPSKLPASQTDFVPPIPVQLSEAVASRLISVEVYNVYTASERKFVQLATDWDWTHSETQAVLKVLKNKRLRLEDVRPDLIRRVLLFKNLVYSTQFHICVSKMNGFQATFLNEEIRKLPAGHPLRQHPTIVDPSNEIQANFVICYFSKNR